MHKAYDVEKAYERSLQNIMISQSITNVLCIVSTKLSIFALKHLFHIII